MLKCGVIIDSWLKKVYSLYYHVKFYKVSYWPSPALGDEILKHSFSLLYLLWQPVMEKYCLLKYEW